MNVITPDILRKLSGGDRAPTATAFPSEQHRPPVKWDSPAQNGMIWSALRQRACPLEHGWIYWQISPAESQEWKATSRKAQTEGIVSQWGCTCEAHLMDFYK